MRRLQELTFIIITLESVLQISGGSYLDVWSTSLQSGPSVYGIDSDRIQHECRRKRIVAGEEVRIDGVYKFAVALVEVVNGRHACDAVCGATVISDRHLVTAAHCIRPMVGYAVAVGSHNMQNCGTSKMRVYPVKASIHPDYSLTPRAVNDLAILKADKGLGVPPIAIGRMNQNPKLKILGWGATIATVRNRAKILRKAIHSLITIADCGKYNIKNLKTNHFCTMPITGAPCSGDSGGPVIREDQPTGKYVLVGVMSLGTPDCSQSQPSVHTLLADDRWIMEQLRKV